MFQYILVLLAVMTVIGGPAMESMASMGPTMEYVVAFGIALMLKPWLETHLE